MDDMKRKPRCSICKKAEGIYRAGEGFKRFCGAECGAILALQIKAKRDAAKVKEVNKEYKKSKAALMTVSDWTKKAQTLAFNPYIRLRDINEPCISCGRYDHEIDEKLTGGKWDAGHYLSRGASLELRFNPLNCHKQCKSCNAGSGKFSKKSRTVGEDYTINLILKIGQNQVDWLNGPHSSKKYTIENLKTIQKWFKRKTNVLIKELEKC